jgi:hypothetical protein
MNTDIKTLDLNHQKVKKLAKVPKQAADNPHREALIQRYLIEVSLSSASLNS